MTFINNKKGIKIINNKLMVKLYYLFNKLDAKFKQHGQKHGQKQQPWQQRKL